MSLETVKKFWVKTLKDEAIKTELGGLAGREPKEIIAAIVEVAAGAGFSFTASEYEAAMNEELARHHRAGELDERELDAVVGGAYSALCSGGGQAPTIRS